MLIRIVKDYKDDSGSPTWSMGSVVDMADKAAHKLVSGGYAEEVKVEAHDEADDDVDHFPGLEEDAEKVYPTGGSPVPEKVAPQAMLAGPDGKAGVVAKASDGSKFEHRADNKK